MVENVTDQSLVSRWAELRDEVEGKRAALFAIEVELRQRMLRNGATEIAHPDYSVKLKLGVPSYDGMRLLPLLEMDVPEAALKKAYIPEHPETRTVPARWDGHGLVALQKLGGMVAQIIEDATFRSDPKLEIKPLKGKE